MENNEIILQDQIKVAVEAAITNIKKRHSAVSSLKTPKQYVEKKGQFDYVAAPYMKSLADKYYPGWSWQIIKFEVVIVNNKTEAIVIHGRLRWYEDGLWREGDMVAAHRIQYKKQIKLDKEGKGIKGADGKWIYERSDELVDMGNDIKAGNTDCMKKAFSTYLNIADDIYKAHIDDLSLNNKEIESILTLAEKVGKRDDIEPLIESEEINKDNYERVVKRLKSLEKEV